MGVPDSGFGAAETTSEQICASTVAPTRLPAGGLLKRTLALTR
ncbi:hypothetical protein OROMI_019712 [Orobanche minor]